MLGPSFLLCISRRYNYKAVPEMGGFAFENGQAVKEWLVSFFQS
jgi:hypothetical protein